VHRRPLKLAVYHEGPVQPHSPELLQASKDKLLDMALRDKERIMLEESRNRLESYIYRVKNKLEDDADQLAKVSTEEQREECRKLAASAQEWMEEEGYGADFATMEDKYAELSVPFEKILLRLSELTARPAAVEALQKRLTEIEQLMEKWSTERPQVTEEERTGVLEKVEGVRKWISEQEEAQAAKKAHEDPAFLSSSVPIQTKAIEALVVRLSKKPKLKPAKNETKADANSTGTGNATAEDDGNATASSASTDTNSTTSSPDANGTDSSTNGTDTEPAGEEL
jgi:hypoxia up-regulated 1